MNHDTKLTWRYRPASPGLSSWLLVAAMLWGAGADRVGAQLDAPGPVAPELVEDDSAVDLDTEGVDVRLSIDGRAQIQLSFDDEELIGTGELPKGSVFQEIQRHIEQKEWAEAIAKLRPIVKGDPNNVSARMLSVTLLSYMGREAEALKLLEEMLVLRPDDFRVLNNAAWYYATAKDKSLRNGPKAIAFARKATLLQPESYHTWSTLAESYYVTGAFEKATKAAIKAFELGTQQQADETNLTEYRMQIWRCNQALAAFSLQQ